MAAAALALRILLPVAQASVVRLLVEAKEVTVTDYNGIFDI